MVVVIVRTSCYRCFFAMPPVSAVVVGTLSRCIS